MTANGERKIVARTKHGEVTIDQLAEVQPGMARLMDELADRFWYMYYSAKEGNWKLSKHNLSVSKSLFKIASTTRPKYAEDLETFAKEFFEPISVAIEKKSWIEFEVACKKSIEASDLYHDKYGYEYIRYVLPSRAPEHLYLGNPEKLKRNKKDRSLRK